jgi:hypothetical protein
MEVTSLFRDAQLRLQVMVFPRVVVERVPVREPVVCPLCDDLLKIAVLPLPLRPTTSQRSCPLAARYAG